MEVGGDSDNRVGGDLEEAACLICRCTNLGETTTSRSAIFQNHSSSSSVLSKHLRIYFLLRHVLELPSEQLEVFLKRYPNPENWVKICSECETKYVGKCEKTFVELLEVKRRFAGARLELIGAIKRSTRGEPKLSKKTKKDGKIQSRVISTVDREIRRFVEENNNYDPHPPAANPFTNWDKLAKAKCGSEELQQEPKVDNDDSTTTNDFEIKEEPTSPNGVIGEINVTNAVPQDDHEEILPDPRSPSENGDPNSGDDWTPDDMSDSSHEDLEEIKTALNSSKAYRLRRRLVTVPNAKKYLKKTSLSIKLYKKALRSLNQPKCDVCGKTFQCLAGLLAHKAAKHPTKTYNCSKCEWTGNYKFLLRRHTTREHGTPEDLKDMTCSTCGRVLGSKHHLEKHLIFCHKEKKNIVCEHCGKEFQPHNKSSFFNHLGTIHNIKDHLKFRCSFPQCERAFYLKCQLENHETLHKPPQHECPTCGAAFHSKYELKKHMDRHSSKPSECSKYNHKCSECELSFASYLQLGSHLIKVHNKNDVIRGGEFKCDQCPLSFRKSKLLRRHLMIKHKVFECTECKWKGNTRAYLQKHLKTEHNKDFEQNVPKQEASSSSSPDKWKCSFENCGKIFRHKSALNRHEIIHKAPSYKCDLCGSAFSYKRSLNVHQKKSCGESGESGMRIEDDKTCVQCNLIFHYRKKFEIHMKEVHGVEETRPESYQCSTCGCTCSNLNTLRNHVHSAHKKKDVCCDLCGKMFRQKWLKKHKKAIHNVEVGTIRCTVEGCKKWFKSEEGRTNHVLSVHENQLPFKCGECGKQFKRKTVLKRHIENIHGDKVPSIISVPNAGSVATPSDNTA